MCMGPSIIPRIKVMICDQKICQIMPIVKLTKYKNCAKLWCFAASQSAASREINGDIVVSKAHFRSLPSPIITYQNKIFYLQQAIICLAFFSPLPIVEPVGDDAYIFFPKLSTI